MSSESVSSMSGSMPAGSDRRWVAWPVGVVVPGVGFPDAMMALALSSGSMGLRCVKAAFKTVFHRRKPLRVRTAPRR